MTSISNWLIQVCVKPMKDKSEVFVEGKPVFYAILYNSMREAALKCGYALALHGSMQSDMDIVAVPWVEDAKPVEELVDAIDDCIGKTIWKENKGLGVDFRHPTEKPHGRIAFTLAIIGDWHIDLSVIKPKVAHE